jgi:hypothetical protein
LAADAYYRLVWRRSPGRSPHSANLGNCWVYS